MYDESTKRKAAWLIVALVLTLISIFFGVNYPIPAPPTSPLDGEIVSLGTTNFTSVTAEDFTATDDITIADDLTVSDDVTISGDATVAGTFAVTGATTQTGAQTISGKLTVNDNALIDGDSDEVQLTVQGYTTQTSNLVVFENSSGTDVFTATNAGAIDVVSTIQYGTNDLYPLGWDSASDKIVCAATGLFTETTTVALSGSFSDVDYAIATQITDPAATGAYLTVDDPGAGTNLVVNSWEPDGTVGTTPVNAFYCAIGDE